MNTATVLLIQDTAGLSAGLKGMLSQLGIAVQILQNAESALRCLEHSEFDCIVFDLDEMKDEAAEFCKKLAAKSESFKICLSASEDTEFFLIAYESGADIVLRKPCDNREVFARIRSMLNRKYRWHAFSRISVKSESRSVSKGKKSVRLSVSECKILEYLLQRPDRYCSAAELLEHACGESDLLPSEIAVQRRVKFMKEKLASIGAEDLICTNQYDNYRAVMSA